MENYYLSKKWGLTSTMDSDGDGFTEKIGGSKELAFSSALGKKKYGSFQLILHLIQLLLQQHFLEV